MLLSSCLGFIRLLSHILPTLDREPWIREWTAELIHEDRRLRGIKRLQLIRRTLGAARDARAVAGSETLFERPGNMTRDLLYALRILLRAPGFTALVVLTLAVGIGANSAIFSALNAILLRPFPFPKAEQLFVVHGTDLKRGIERGNLSYPDFLDLRQRSETIDSLAAFDSDSLNVVVGNRSDRLQGAYVSAGLFSTLGIEPILGRRFSAEDDRTGAAPVAIVSDRVWGEIFGRNPRALGQTIQIEGRPHELVGVIPRLGAFPDYAEAWIPLALDPTRSPRASHWLNAVGRLKSGASLQQAQSEARGIANQLAAAFEETNRGRNFNLVGLRQSRAGEFPQIAAALFCFVGFLLLLACVNVANLQLTRSTGRVREMAVRSALGAGRFQLLRQILAENLLLAAGGALLGLFIARTLVSTFTKMVPDGLPPWLQIQTDWRVLLFTIGLLVLVAFLFGLLPCRPLIRPDLNAVIRSQSRGHFGREKRTRNLLIVAEVALSAVLLVGAGLMLRSFLTLSTRDPGFSREGVVTLRLELPRAFYPRPQARLDFFQRLIEEAESLSGVQRAGLISRPPLRGSSDLRVVALEGQTAEEVRRNPWTLHNSVSPGYFQSAGIPLRQGRLFSNSQPNPPEVIVSDLLARQFWPDQDPIGQQLTASYPPLWLTVVGVVGSVRADSLVEKPNLQLYEPMGQNPGSAMTLFVRTVRSPETLVPALRSRIRALDPRQPVYDVMTTREILDEALWDRRLFTSLLGVFATIGLILALGGLYGLTCYLVSRRRYEVGIRMALGAPASGLIGLILGQSMRLILIGLGVGLAASALLSRTLSGFLPGISPWDPITYLAVGLALGSVALLASWVPAQRILRVDPTEALRAE